MIACVRFRKRRATLPIHERSPLSMWKLPDFWKVIIDRGSAGGPHPEGGRTSRDLFLRCTSDRPTGTLGLISSSHMENLADQCEGWACTPNLHDSEAARLNGKAIGFRLLAKYLGPFQRPHEPPKSLHGLLAGKD